MTWTTLPRSSVGPLSAVTGGAGPLVVLIHGVGLRAEAWSPQIEHLSRRCRVLAIDLPGHGESARLPHPATLADYSDRAAATLDTPAVVVGHSLGAMIALDMAIRHPASVTGVVALNAIYQRDAAAKAAVKARADSLDGQTTADPATTLERWFGTSSSPERRACEDWLTSVDPAGYRTAYTVFARENGPKEADLRGLACPALFVTGGREPNSTPAMSAAMAAAAPNGHAQIFEDAAHMLPMTHAAQVNRLLPTFVSTISERT